MGRMVKLLVATVVGVLILGCEGPKIKQAVDALSPQICEIANQVLNTEGTILKVDSVITKVASGKIKKTQVDTVMMDIEKIQTELSVLLALEDAAKEMKDTLNVLDKKASGDNKKAISGLNEKLNMIVQSINKARNGSKALEQLKVKLEDMKKGPAKPDKAAKKK